MWVATTTIDVTTNCPYCGQEMIEYDESQIYEDGAYYLYWICQDPECEGGQDIQRVMKFQLVDNRTIGGY